MQTIFLNILAGTSLYKLCLGCVFTQSGVPMGAEPGIPLHWQTQVMASVHGESPL